jgi:hypothetical protein
MIPFRHLVLTRLALGHPGESWLKHRIRIFEVFCAPSMRNQNCRNFNWLLALNPNTPPWFVSRVKAAYPAAILIFGESAGLAIDWHNRIPKELFASVLLTTRLDNDDMLHKDFIGEVQRFAGLQQNPCALNPPLGYNMDQQSFTCYRQRTPHNHFLSLLEFNTRDLVYCKKHNDIPKFYRTIDFCSAKPLWVEGVNAMNIVNSLKPAGDPIAWSKIQRDFLTPCRS